MVSVSNPSGAGGGGAGGGGGGGAIDRRVGYEEAHGIPRSSFMQVPLSLQSEQLSRGRKVFEELSSFAKDKFQIEDMTARAVIRANQLGAAAENEISGGSLQRGLLALRHFSAMESRQRSKLARNIQEQFYQPLELAMTRHAELVMRSKVQVQRSAQLVQDTENRLTKAKRQVSKAVAEEEAQRDALSKASKDIRTSQKDIDWLMGKVSRAADSVHHTEATVVGERHQLLQAIQGRDEAVTSAARNFEVAERDRLLTVSRAVASYAARQAEFHAGQLKELEAVTQAFAAFDPGGDVDAFIERKRSMDHVPLYRVALSLLDWAGISSELEQPQRHLVVNTAAAAAAAAESGRDGGSGSESIDGTGSVFGDGGTAVGTNEGYVSANTSVTSHSASVSVSSPRNEGGVFGSLPPTPTAVAAAEAAAMLGRRGSEEGSEAPHASHELVTFSSSSGDHGAGEGSAQGDRRRCSSSGSGGGGNGSAVASEEASATTHVYGTDDEVAQQRVQRNKEEQGAMRIDELLRTLIPDKKRYGAAPAAAPAEATAKASTGYASVIFPGASSTVATASAAGGELSSPPRSPTMKTWVGRQISGHRGFEMGDDENDDDDDGGGGGGGSDDHGRDNDDDEDDDDDDDGAKNLMDDYRAALSLVEKGLSATAAFETGRQRRDSRRRLLQQLQQGPDAADATATVEAPPTGKAAPVNKAPKITHTSAAAADTDWRRAGERGDRHRSATTDSDAGAVSSRAPSDASSAGPGAARLSGVEERAGDRGGGGGPVTAEQARRELEVLVRSESGRARFLQALNERRSEATEVTPEAYDALVATLHVFLDGCGPSPPQPPTPPTPAPTAAAKPPPPMTPTTPATTGTRSSSRVSPSFSTPHSINTGRSPPVSPAGAFVGRPSARRRRRTGSAARAKHDARGESNTLDRRKQEVTNGDGTSNSTADLPAAATTAIMEASETALSAEGGPGRWGDSKGTRGTSMSPGGRNNTLASLTLPPRASFTLGSSLSAAPPQTTPTRVPLGATPLGTAPSLGSPTRPRASTVAITTTVAPATTSPPTPQAPNANASGNTSPANRSTVSSSSSSIGVGGGAAGVNRQQRSTGANLLEFAAAIMRGGGNANSSGSAGSVRSSGSGGAGGAVGPVAQSRAWGLRGAGAGGGGGVGGWAERRNLIPGARGVQASSGSSVSGGRGGSASGTVGTAAGWFDPYSISNLGGGYHPAMQHGTLAETVELALGRGRVGGGGGGAATSSRGRSGSVYDIGVNPRLQGEGGTVGGIGMEGYMDIRSARQAMILANTFFKTEHEDDGSTVGSVDGGGDGREGRTYLLKELRDHPLWKHPQFWHEALMLGVKEQLQEGLANVSKWDDLKGEARREAVARTHNVVFSQLASIAFNMLECGVDGARVRSDVTRKCRESQLGEAQVQELLRDLDRRIRLSEAEHDRLGRLPSAASTVMEEDEDEPQPAPAMPTGYAAELSTVPPRRPASTPPAAPTAAPAAAAPSVVAAFAGTQDSSRAGDAGGADPMRSALAALPAPAPAAVAAPSARKAPVVAIADARARTPSHAMPLPTAPSTAVSRPLAVDSKTGGDTRGMLPASAPPAALGGPPSGAAGAAAGPECASAVRVLFPTAAGSGSMVASTAATPGQGVPSVDDREGVVSHAVEVIVERAMAVGGAKDGGVVVAGMTPDDEYDML